MQNILPAKSRDTAPASVVGALLTVCLQHCDSILILLQNGKNHASVEALLRPTFESSFRLIWLNEDKERAKLVMAKKANFPSFSHLIRKFAKMQVNNGLPDPVTSLHDSTHAGMWQLAQHFSETKKETTPILETMGFRLSAILVVMLAMIALGSFCEFTQRKEDQERIAAIWFAFLTRSTTEFLTTCTSLASQTQTLGSSE